MNYVVILVLTQDLLPASLILNLTLTLTLTHILLQTDIQCTTSEVNGGDDHWQKQNYLPIELYWVPHAL
jgi:hypothetical protein